MTQNHILLIILIMTTAFKALADGYLYLFNKYHKPIHGKIYHIYGFLSIIFVFGIGLFNLSIAGLFLTLLAYTLMYSFVVCVVYNITTNHNILYIGLTDGTDLWIRKIFKISNEFSKEYKLLTAKQKQRENFRKAIVMMIRFVLFVAGMAIISDLI